MTFLAQTWSGVCKEFAVYKHKKRLLFSENLSVLISMLFSLITRGVFYYTGRIEDTGFLRFMASPIIFYSLVSGTLNKLLNDKETNFREHLMVNGMRKSSYYAKIMSRGYILSFFIAIEKSFEMLIWSHQIRFYAVLGFFPKYFFSGVALVSVALLLSTFLTLNYSSKITMLLFIFLPFLTFSLQIENTSWWSHMIYVLHPLIGSDYMMQTFTKFVEKQYLQEVNLYLLSKSPGNTNILEVVKETQAKIARLDQNCMLTLCDILLSAVIYLILFLLIERISLGKKPKINIEEEEEDMRVERDVAISMCVIKNDLKDLERPLKKKERVFSSSALYSENLIKLNESKKTIRVEGLKKVYGEYTVLNDVSFTINEQEIFCLLGHNGAGKSTLVNILTGLISATEGNFYYNEKDVFGNILEIQESVGFCAQQDFALENNTVYENLEFFAEIKKVPKEKVKSEVERVLRKFDLLKFENMLAFHLNGGLKRRLNIAIALSNDPKIIIMDEPTSGMDPVTRREYWEILRKLRQEKKTIVITTQFLDEAEELCDKVAILSKGRLFAVGTVDYIKKKFGTGYNLLIQNTEKPEKLRNQAFEITSKVHNMIPEAYIKEGEANILKFVLPFTAQNKFARLFGELENIDGIQMSLQLMSLEESFVRLEMSSDRMVGKEDVYNDESKAILHRVPLSFYEKKSRSLLKQMKALLLLRRYRFKEESKEKWTLVVAIILFIVGKTQAINFDVDEWELYGVSLMPMLIAASVMTPIFINSVSNDRNKKITNVLRVQGVGPFWYWFGMLVGDFLYQLPLFITVLICFSQDFNGSGQLAEFGILYIAFTLNLLSFSYNLSSRFRVSDLAWIGGPITLLGGIFLVNILTEFFSFWFSDLDRYVFTASCFVFGPSVALFLGASSIMAPRESGEDTIYQFERSWPYTCVLLMMTAIDFAIIIRRSCRLIEPEEKKIFNNKLKKKEKEFVEDPINQKALNSELQRLISRNNKDVIKIMELQKTYPNGYQALESLDFGVEKGQIFCLLGINGAGKTTCLEILTNKIPKSGGTVEIKGQETFEFYKSSSEASVCSQTNTLWDCLTVVQHFRIYAQMRGLEGQEAEQVIHYLLYALQLEVYSERRIRELSMGTRRKLCVGLSVVSAPEILFLDEPSTGVDPVGRNQIWDLIKTAVKSQDGVVLLTTQYIQEAESIGDKIGLLVHGGLTTIGTTADLKKRHAHYLITIGLAVGGASKAKIEKIVKFVLPEATNDEHSKPDEMIFKVPANNMKFSKIFEVLEEAKSHKEINEFAIYMTTLEQIFVRIVKDHIKAKAPLLDI